MAAASSVFANEFQGGSFIELLAPGGSSPLASWKVAGPPKALQKVEGGHEGGDGAGHEGRDGGRGMRGGRGPGQRGQRRSRGLAPGSPGLIPASLSPPHPEA